MTLEVVVHLSSLTIDAEVEKSKRYARDISPFLSSQVRVISDKYTLSISSWAYVANSAKVIPFRFTVNPVSVFVLRANLSIGGSDSKGNLFFFVGGVQLDRGKKVAS